MLIRSMKAELCKSAFKWTFKFSFYSLALSEDLPGSDVGEIQDCILLEFVELVMAPAILAWSVNPFN
jgi:hypothetical protein